MSISTKKIPGGLCAISCLEYIYQKFGFHVLDRSLRLCIGTWEGDHNSLTANMLKGIARLIIAFGDVIKDDAFKDKVGKFSSREISRIAKERNAGSQGYAEAMLIAYNKKMKNPLKWAKLYSAKQKVPDDELDMEENDFDIRESEEDDA